MDKTGRRLKSAFVLSILIVNVHSNLFGRIQSTRVTGRLLCGTAPAPNIQVKLEDYDLGGLLYF